MKKSTITTGICSVLVAGVGVVGGVVIASSTGLGTSAPASASLTQSETLEPLGVNDSGLTYGSLAGHLNPDDAPDLILVAGNEGRDGYVRKADFFQPLPASPQEATAQMTARRTSADLTIPVFDVDGVTQIDTFTMTAP